MSAVSKNFQDKVHAQYYSAKNTQEFIKDYNQVIQIYTEKARQNKEKAIFLGKFCRDFNEKVLYNIFGSI